MLVFAVLWTEVLSSFPWNPNQIETRWDNVRVPLWQAFLDVGEMNSSHLRVMRFARLARALRGVRVIRLLRYVSALRTIVLFGRKAGCSVCSNQQHVWFFGGLLVGHRFRALFQTMSMHATRRVCKLFLQCAKTFLLLHGARGFPLSAQWVLSCGHWSFFWCCFIVPRAHSGVDTSAASCSCFGHSIKEENRALVRGVFKPAGFGFCESSSKSRLGELEQTRAPRAFQILRRWTLRSW